MTHACTMVQILRILDAHDFASGYHVPLGHFLHLVNFRQWFVRKSSFTHVLHFTLHPDKVTLL